MHKIFLVFLFVIAQQMHAQFSTQSLDIEQGSLWIGGTLGLNYFENETARINQQTYIGENIQNSLTLRINPTAKYAILNGFFVGAHLGFDYFYAELPNATSTINSRNYKIGSQLNYYFFRVVPGIHLQAELGANYNFLNNTSSITSYPDLDNSYFKSYFNMGVSFFISGKFEVALIFKDLLSYHSSSPNFDGRKDFSGSKVFKEFVNFPHISFFYRLK